MKIFSYKNLKNEKVLKIFGVTLYKQKYRFGFKVRSYVFGLFKIKSNKSLRKYYVIGIQIWKKYDENYKIKLYIDGNQKRLSNELRKVIDSQTKILRRVDDVFVNMQVLNQVQNLHRTFLPYKRAFEGKDVVLYGAGPTVKDYIYIKNAIQVGVNGAINLENVKLDYLFVHDHMIANKQMNERLDAYGKGFCKKFYAILPHRQVNRIRERILVDRIPQYHLYNADAVPFLLEDVFGNKWAVDIDNEPFGDFGGAVFSALQFILYAHPKRIFLVGQDCNKGYFYNAEKIEMKEGCIAGDNSGKTWGYKKFKEFVEQMYPDVEIISVNPVGLKGLFTDIYTKDNEYVMQNGEIFERGLVNYASVGRK